MASDVWEIMIPQICKDFYDWENRTWTILNYFKSLSDK